jgi:hypothetical protein
MPNTYTVASLTALAQLTPAAGDSAILTEAGREGVFRWSANNHSSGFKAIANHVNTAVTSNGGGWFGIEKTGGAAAYDAGAVSSVAAQGAFAIRLRRWKHLSFTGVGVGANSAPQADATHAMTLRMGISGDSYFLDAGTGPSEAAGAHAWDRYDLLLHRNSANQVKVYSLPRSIVIEANRLQDQLDRHGILIHTYAATHSGPLYFDSSIYYVGHGAQVQFIDIGAAGDGLVGADEQKGVAVAPASDPSGASGAWLRVIESLVKVGWFGAKGDGVTNDSAALAGASAYIRRMGGGTLELEPRTYVIGGQTRRGSELWAYEPHKVLYFAYCDRKVTIRGNGCTLKCAPGLKYGKFDPATEAAASGGGADATYRASPMEGAITAEFNNGDIEIDGINVDGNLQSAVIGGSFGDSGIQIPFDGFRLYDNSGRITLRNCKAVRLGLDGLNIRRNIVGKGGKAQPALIEDFEACECGRQGASFVGARMLTVINSQFLRTGKNGYVASSPCAGVDVEAEEGSADEILFLNCISSFNAGANFGVASWQNSRILWKGGRLVGTDTYAIWIEKPSVRFEDALIVGAVMCDWADNMARGTLEEGYAPGFVRCMFSDNTEYSEGLPLANNHIQVRNGRVWFQRCSFDYRRTFVLPAIETTDESVVFEDCDLHCDVGGTHLASWRAVWLGVNTFSGIGLGNMNYFDIKDVGGVVRWGAGGSKVHDWPAIAPSGSATTTVPVNRAKVGDGYVYTAHMLEDDMNFAGLTFTAAATADNVVTVTATNMWGTAVDLASGTLIVEVRGGRRYFEGAETRDLPSVAPCAATTTTVDVPGARAGDRRAYAATLSGGWGGLVASCEATADDVVTVTAFNPTGAAINPPSGTLRVTGVR